MFFDLIIKTIRRFIYPCREILFSHGPLIMEVRVQGPIQSRDTECALDMQKPSG